MNCIVVENDGEYQEVEYTPSKPLDELTKEEILNLIGEAGIVGMGGAGFPTKVKLSPKQTVPSVSRISLQIIEECLRIRKNLSVE